MADDKCKDNDRRLKKHIQRTILCIFFYFFTLFEKFLLLLLFYSTFILSLFFFFNSLSLPCSSVILYNFYQWKYFTLKAYWQCNILCSESSTIGMLWLDLQALFEWLTNASSSLFFLYHFYKNVFQVQATPWEFRILPELVLFEINNHKQSSNH